eukprot:Seg152.4 transcript_id=Seg152.4/GoldUCD/mRNA.D3Y31 product="Leucine-rich repeat-containing protein 57" protein_id=Seg152.4/GoldUCD/D3Y31
MGNSLAPQIENAQKTGVCSLNGKGLKELPPEFSRLSKVLRTTDLSNNRLEELPAIIGEFKNLKSLTVNNNRLESIPDVLGNLTKLETLSLNGNRLTMIPSTIFIKMKNLTTLSLCNNKLRIFPVEICELTKLNVVDLSGNLMDHIPDTVGSLKAMELNLNGNRLATLPLSLVNCERLKVLRVEENCLGLEAISTDLLRDSQIAVLAADGNLFQMKDLRDKDGYEKYMERYTATKKKFV